jgi:hypothetical protein
MPLLLLQGHLSSDAYLTIFGGLLKGILESLLLLAQLGDEFLLVSELGLEIFDLLGLARSVGLELVQSSALLFQLALECSDLVLELLLLLAELLSGLFFAGQAVVVVLK